MIVLDIETSGLYPEKHGIWQIGAIDFDNPGSIFLDECRIDDEDEVTDGAMQVHGKTEVYLRDKNKQAQEELIDKFFIWTKERKIKNCVCQNPHFDLGFIMTRARKYGLEIPLAQRSFDMHTIAAMKYYEINKKFLIKEDHSEMNLSNVLELCGLKDERREHNALEDAKLIAECLNRLLHGRNMFEEYKNFKIPSYLTSA